MMWPVVAGEGEKYVYEALSVRRAQIKYCWPSEMTEWTLDDKNFITFVTSSLR